MRRRNKSPKAEAFAQVRLEDLDAQNILDIAYQLLLRRRPDAVGAATHLQALQSGQRTPWQLVEWITSSAEYAAVNHRTELGPSLQQSRSAFVKSLPRATRILDLGGTALHTPEGAFVGALGYPYQFEKLVIVDLPAEDRHQIYRDDASNNEVTTPQGTISYRYHSMTDLSSIASGSIDLVYIGQAIEHVTMTDADIVLREARRVLDRSGYLALDTPNARVTRLQQADFIDPDHKHEYTHAEMTEKLKSAGFELIGQNGLNYAGCSLGSGEFILEEVARNSGIYAAIEDCYLLSYLCRPLVVRDLATDGARTPRSETSSGISDR